MNNIAPKLQKCWTHKIAFKIISKMLKQPNFFYSQSSTLPQDAPAKFCLSTTFGSSFAVSSVAPTRSSTFCAYLITKIGNRNLKVILLNLLKLKICNLHISVPEGSHQNQDLIAVGYNLSFSGFVCKRSSSTINATINIPPLSKFCTAHPSQQHTNSTSLLL